MHGHPSRFSSNADWETARELGRLAADVAHLQADVTALDQHREKHKMELDRIKTWLERAVFLAVLALAGLGGHATAPIVGSAIGNLLRGLAGLTPG